MVVGREWCKLVYNYHLKLLIILPFPIPWRKQYLPCPHPMIPVIFKFINIIHLSRLTVIRSFYDRHNTFRSHAPMTITVCSAPARRESPVIELPDQRPEAASWTRQPFHWILRLLVNINTLILYCHN